MTAPASQPPSLDAFVATLTHPNAALELLVVGACLMLAWALVRLMKGAVAHQQPSVLLDRKSTRLNSSH